MMQLKSMEDVRALWKNRETKRESLLALRSKTARGLWGINGEPGPDGLEGRILGYARGRWADVVEYALYLPGFFGDYGTGGSVDFLDASIVVVPKNFQERRGLIAKRLDDAELDLIGMHDKIAGYKKLLGKE